MIEKKNAVDDVLFIIRFYYPKNTVIDLLSPKESVGWINL